MTSQTSSQVGAAAAAAASAVSTVSDVLPDTRGRAACKQRKRGQGRGVRKSRINIENGMKNEEEI